MSEIKSKHIPVIGAVTTLDKFFMAEIDCIVTNDEIGKTLSLYYGDVQFTIPFEPLEKYLMDK
jgi:hypothetical protein